MRDSVRAAISGASHGATEHVPMTAVAGAIAGNGLRDRWRAVQMIENHDTRLCRPRPADRAAGRRQRSAIVVRAQPQPPRHGATMTSPGIPMLFMGQEILAHEPWNDTPGADTSIPWAALEAGDKIFSRFPALRARELIGVRRRYEALRGEGCAIIHVHDDNRVLAFQRWVEGQGARCRRGLQPQRKYDFRTTRSAFPGPGRWREVFNSDVYDNWVNPIVAGNGGGVDANGPALHGLARLRWIDNSRKRAFGLCRD